LTTTLLSWPLPVLLAGLLVSLGAGVVRGFAGFGYSALTVAGLAVFVAPATVVPAVLALEVLASISMMRSALQEADRAWLRWLLVGNLLFIPVGITLLTVLPETLLRLLVGGALLASAVGLKLASEHRFAPTPGLRITAGIASGLLNGVAASGGVAAAMLMAASRLAPAALRATMVTFLLCAGAYALLCAALVPRGMGTTRLFTIDTLRWALLLAPTMLGGIWIGRHAFTNVDPARYRRHVLDLLIVISALGMLRAAFDLAQR
jgi:uncharacterized membrane protein YfcA